MEQIWQREVAPMVRHQFTAERPIDASTLARVWEFYTSNPTVRSCVSVLRACISSGELVARGGDGSPVVDRHCRQLLERALDWMLVLGIVPVTSGTIVAPDGGRVSAPVVPGNDFVILIVVTHPESGHVSYTGNARSQGLLGSMTSSRRNKRYLMVWDAGKDTPTGVGRRGTLYRHGEFVRKGATVGGVQKVRTDRACHEMQSPRVHTSPTTDKRRF